MDYLIALSMYLFGLFVTHIANKHEFVRCPEKGKRYKALPIPYKLGCWCVVLPLFAAIAFHGEFFILAFLAFLLLESACVRWYRKNGHL